MAEPNHSRYVNPDNDPNGPWIAVNITAPGRRDTLAFEFEGHRPPVGRHWQFTREKMKELKDLGRLLVQAGTAPRQKKYVLEIEKDLDTNEVEMAYSGVVSIISCAMKALAQHISKHPAALHHIEWRQLEHLMCEVLSSLGFDARLTREAKDGGFDIELLHDKKSYLVEVKCWSAPNLVGEGIVANFANVVVREGATRGLLLSRSGFRKKVIEGRLEIERHKVALGDSSVIVALCKMFSAPAGRLFIPLPNLPELIFKQTFDPASVGTKGE